MVSFAEEMPHHQGQRVPLSGYKKKEGEAREERMGTERVAGMKRGILYFMFDLQVVSKWFLKYPFIITYAGAERVVQP